jgi:hypothetical protein
MRQQRKSKAGAGWEVAMAWTTSSFTTALTCVWLWRVHYVSTMAAVAFFYRCMV